VRDWVKRQCLDGTKLCRELPFAQIRTEMEVRSDLPRAQLPTELFKSPMVVEVIGAGFDRQSNTDFFSLRFPRIIKIHQDRCSRDAVSFDEYQHLARRSMENLREDDSLMAEAAPRHCYGEAVCSLKGPSRPHITTGQATSLSRTIKPARLSVKPNSLEP
jgi:hypothetical protein